MAENSNNNNGNKRVAVVGIAGVGKTTVISQAAKILNQKGHKTAVVVFGTTMLEEAKKIGLKNRDEIRNLPIKDQQHLQDMAAKRIAEMKDNIVIVDTHVFINTTEGYYPGLPMRLLNIIKPTHMVMIAADPQEILNRRKSNGTRQRDIISEENIQHELDISKVMVTSCSVLTGSPFIIITNNDNKTDEAASYLIKVLAGGAKKK
ncbi:MAG TPA: adenylate kinase [Nitrososphaeraceae archaeon]|nr:adenylate kinase [Nitrososphaeraceae archaeon]